MQKAFVSHFDTHYKVPLYLGRWHYKWVTILTYKILQAS